MKTETKTSDTIIARTYVIDNGQQEHALIRNQAGRYLVAVNGTVPDARFAACLTLQEAREWYDEAAYKMASRP